MRRARGYTLIEVLIAIVLVSIGLLGAAGLQARAQQAQVEAYQRAQAMTLVTDIVERIELNRGARGCYQTNNSQGQEYVVGTGREAFPPCTGFGNNQTRTLANADIAAWDDLLDGASESLDGADVGGLVGARGCIDRDPTADTITVSLAWQGDVATGAPTGSTCGQGEYGDEALRRVLSETIVFADLDS